MPSLANHTSISFTKALSIGDSMSGKTGALVSLVAAGYNLRILDLDNKLDILKGMIERECPDKIANVEYRTLRDKRKASTNGSVIDGAPKAWVNALKMCDKWKYDDVDLGAPADWGPEAILVIDSLSRLCDAAFDFHLSIIPVGKSGDFDMRAVYKNAQDDVENFLALLTSEGMETNVIVIAHVQYMELPDGTTKGFPQGVGQKLSPKVAQYFPTSFLFTNKSGKRVIQTASTPLIDLANPKPFEMAKEYPISTGLADIFGVLRQPPAAKPKAVTLRRA